MPTFYFETVALQRKNDSLSVNWQCQFFAARQGTIANFADLVVARSIIECAARHSNSHRAASLRGEVLKKLIVKLLGRAQHVIPPYSVVYEH